MEAVEEAVTVQAVETIVDDWLESSVFAGLAYETRGTYHRTIRKFLAWMAQEKDSGHPVTDTDIRRWRDAQEGKPETVNSRLLPVVSFFSWGVERGLLPVNPAAGVESLSPTGTPKTRERMRDRKKRGGRYDNMPSLSGHCRLMVCTGRRGLIQNVLKALDTLTP